MTINRSTWIAVADGAKAIVLKYQGPNTSPELVEGGKMAYDPKLNQDMVTSKQGRVFHSADSGRSAMERPTEPHEQAKEDFARNLGEFLSAKSSDFDRLFIAAAPKTLGSIRKSLSGEVSHKVSMELSKDLTHLPVADIPEHFGQLLNSSIRP